ncbi:Pyruvate carboxyltransferase [Gossypium australe]|uniref:Pyruvate carboxyltransferase n=1 Tax=Gossypium australe TaxID=47621 RepID=A0A5B6UU21_9ROSI|nr:Pyruvate carboxyltransferase [Gossypium australe]
MLEFSDALDNCGLTNMGFVGSRPDCATVLKTTWCGAVLLVPDKLLLAKEALRNWDEGCKKDCDEHISCLHMQLDALQHQIVLDSILSDMALIKVQFAEIERKEIYWAYRGRVNWLKHGYKNTSFFHRSHSQMR